jgi:hypothetical protein
MALKLLYDSDGRIVGRVQTGGSFVTAAANTPSGVSAIDDTSGGGTPVAEPETHYIDTSGSPAISDRPAFAPGLSSTYSLNTTVTPNFAGADVITVTPPAGYSGSGGRGGGLVGDHLALSDGDTDTTLDAHGVWTFRASGFPYLDYQKAVTV